LTRWDEERKKIHVEIQTSPKLEELIKFKDLIKLLIDFMDSIKDFIEEKKVWRPNSNQFTKIERLETQLKLWKAELVKSKVQLQEIWSLKAKRGPYWKKSRPRTFYKMRAILRFVPNFSRD
jgi:hypothetical protein